MKIPLEAYRNEQTRVRGVGTLRATLRAARATGLAGFRPTRRRTWWVILAGSGLLALLGAWAFFGRSRHERPAPAWVEVTDFSHLLNDSSGTGLPGHLAAERLTNIHGSSRDERVRAIRIGAGTADLQVVSWARNRAANGAYRGDPVAQQNARRQGLLVAAIAHELALELDDVPNGADGATLFRWTEDEARRGATISWHERQLAREIALRYHPRYVLAGNWLETVRVAALRGDTAFFHTPDVLAGAALVASLEDLSPATRAAIDRLHARLLARSMTDFDTVERGATAVLTDLANW